MRSTARPCVRSLISCMRVVAERDDAKRAENMNRMIELVADTWIAVPILEGMGYWAVNPKHVGAFARAWST